MALSAGNVWEACSDIRPALHDYFDPSTIASPSVIESNNLLKSFKSHLLSLFGNYEMYSSSRIQGDRQQVLALVQA